MKKTRYQKSWSKRNIPEELWREILSLLPVKSLLRFRAVSRSWRTSIADPDFARLHLTRFKNNRNESHLFAVQDDSYGRRECALRRSKTFRITARLGSFGADSIVCSVDGLFMLKQKKLVLWNPSIRKTLALPPSPAISSSSAVTSIKELGLGFDPSIKDYKYVRFGSSSTAVYTVGSNSWKTIGQERSLLFDFSRLNLGRTVCFRGYLVAPAIHTSDGRDHSMTLFSFDLSNEVYASTDLPGDNYPDLHARADGLTIADGGRSMQLVCLSFRKGSVWVLEGDLGPDIESWSWTQRYTFATTFHMDRLISWGLRFLHLSKNGEILFRAVERVMSLKLETHEQKIVRRKNVFRIWLYMESLILH